MIRHWLRRLTAPLIILVLALMISTLVVQMLGLIRPRQDPMLLLDLQSNYVDFSVSRPGAATVALRGGWVPRAPECLGATPDENLTRLTALLAPVQGTRVEYIWAPRTVSLRYSAATAGAQGGDDSFLTVMREGQPDCQISGRPFVVILPHEALSEMAPLPILGAGRIGSETLAAAPPEDAPSVLLLPATGDMPAIEATASAGNFLHGGTVSVYGRTSRTGPPAAVFRVSEADFQIPRGSRVDFGLDAGQDQGAGDVLRGLAVLDDAGQGFAIEAVTNASDVQISGITGVTTFAAGAVVTAVSDPTFAPLLVFLASFIFLFPTFITIYQMVTQKE